MNNGVKRKQAYQKIDTILFLEDKIRKEVLAIRNDHISHGNTQKPTHSDPTALEAINKCIEIKSIEINGIIIEKPEKWLQILNIVYTSCNEVERKILVARYKKFRKTAVICSYVHIHRSAYFSILKSIKSLIAELAIQKGLLTVF